MRFKIMKIYRRLSDLGREKEKIRLAAGFFDGVHRGHQAVIRRVIEEAGRRGEAAWIMTFDMHPLRLLQPLAAPPLLTSLEHKIRLLAGSGVRGCLVLRFTRSMAGMSPQRFIERLARAVPNLRGMVVGHNWTFGRHGAGTPAVLKKLGARHGFGVTVVRPLRWRGGLISSTRIRREVAGGRLDEAAAMLGRRFNILGTVVSGRGIGRKLGVPTANINLHHEMAPANGVYAIRAVIGRQIFDGVANIGLRPTFKSRDKAAPRKKILEAHLFNVRADLRGREIDVFFVEKIREERRFPSSAALRHRIGRDILAARKALGH